MIPSNQEYQDMLPASKKLDHKCEVEFKIFDMPGLLKMDNQFLKELNRLPANSPIFATDFIHHLLTYKW